MNLVTDDYTQAFEDGYAVGHEEASGVLVRILHVMEADLDEALGEATHLADEVDRLKHMLDLAQTDDLE